MSDAGNGIPTVPTPNAGGKSVAEFPLEIPRDLLWLTPRYEFVRELGRGMAVVYLARARDGGSDEPGREVAVKVVAPPHAADRETVDRFAREARTATALTHPNIVRTLAIETSGDAVAIVTEYISGETLRAMLKERGALPFSRAAAILRDVASALAHAHATRIVHRDVKPENIFVETGTGRALLGDFGIARSIDADALLTHDGASLGTPAYMAPEQVDGLPVDERTDVYALGLLGWEMLTGRRPWQGETLYALLQKQKTEPLPDLARLRPDVPLFLHRAIEGALAKDPAARWRDAHAMLEQLSPAPEHLPEPASPEGNADAVVRLDVITGRTVQFAMSDVEAFRHAAPTDATVTALPLPDDYLRDREAVARLPVRRRGRRRWAAALAAAIAVGGALLAITYHPGPPSSGDPQLDSLLDRAAPPRAPGARAGTADPRTAGPLDPARRDPARRDTGRRDTGGADSGRRQALHRDSASGTLVADSPVSFRLTRPTAAAPTAAVPTAAVSKAGALAAAAPAAAAAAPTASTTTPAVRATHEAPARLSARDACRSSANADQRRCLMGLIYRSDVALQRNYDALIVALRRRAGGAADPPTVRALRAEQRAWVDARDRECAREVPLARAAHWGVARAPCFSGFSQRRAALLAARLRGKVPMAH